MTPSLHPAARRAMIGYLEDQDVVYQEDGVKQIDQGDLEDLEGVAEQAVRDAIERADDHDTDRRRGGAPAR